eukprot:scaffold83934_cov66-Phaeocystis_antarctica.AAC.1
MTDGLLAAVRGLWLADPELSVKPLLAKLREQQPDLGADKREVIEALLALKAESEATEAAAAPLAADTPPAPFDVTLSLACFGCARLPSEMGDDREKHPVCAKCVKLKVPTTYWCCLDCPGNPGAWKRHAVYHKGLKVFRKRTEDGGALQQRHREMAEEAARDVAQSGDAYTELVAEGLRYISKEDTRRAARKFREAIALKPDGPLAYFNLGVVLNNSGHTVEAAQRMLEAKERFPTGSEMWGRATASAFIKLAREVCDEVAKPEWWTDEGLKALSARVVRAAPDDVEANQMRAEVLGRIGRSAAELKKAATHYERAAALCDAPAQKAWFADHADLCRSLAM